MWEYLWFPPYGFHRTIMELVFNSTISFIYIKFLIRKAKYYVIKPDNLEGSPPRADRFLWSTCYRGAYNEKHNI